LIHEVGDRVTRDRIVTFTDGVLAIVVTLLVLNIAVPQLSRSEVETELPKRLLELLPDIWSYATSFIILGFFWIAHDDQFHYIKRANRTLSWITIFYLMFIAFIPFSTALIGEYRDQEVSIIVYGINIIIVLIFAYLQWGYATKGHHLVDIDIDPNLVTITSRRQFVGMILYAFGIVISFLNTQVSLALFILIPLNCLMPKKYFLIRSTKNK
jgi:uncharacterized membrane protein